MADEEEKNTSHGRATAQVRRSWWPGWIWAIPIAALLVVGWLALRALTSGGESVSITFNDVHGLNANNADVTYRGMKIGSVSGMELTKDGKAVVVKASIQAGATQFLRTGTRFWLRGANPSLGNLASLGSVLSGPTLVMDPGPGTKATTFTGFPYEPIAPANSKGQDYQIDFEGDVGALKRGDPVKLRGFNVGQIKDIKFGVGMGDAISTPIIVTLYPALFNAASGAANTGDTFQTSISTLIENGMRARLDRDPPLIGSYAVTLDMVPGAPSVMPVVANGLPQIPVAPAGGLNSLLGRLNKVPIDQIAQNVLDATKQADDAIKHVDQLVSSSELKDSVQQLDASLKEVRGVVSKAGPQITDLISNLRNTATKLDQVATSANKIVGDAATQNDLKSAVREITEAARGVREFADYLDRHPEALIRGKG